MAHVLYIGQAGPDLLVGEHLAARQHHLTHAATLAAGLEVQRAGDVDVIVLEVPLADSGAGAALRQLRALDERAVVLVAGVDGEVHGASEALALGAYDYVAEARREPARLIVALGICLEARRSDAQLRYLRRKDAAQADWQTLVATCPAMRQVVATVRKLSQRTSSAAAPVILLTGETGTGKGLLAKVIHYNSVRRGSAFVEVNCAAIAPTLIEAELFGHVKGPSRTRGPRAPGCSRRPTAAPCCSTRSPPCRSTCRPSCWPRSRTGRSGASATPGRRPSTCS